MTNTTIKCPHCSKPLDSPFDNKAAAAVSPANAVAFREAADKLTMMLSALVGSREDELAFNATQNRRAEEFGAIARSFAKMMAFVRVEDAG